MANKIDVKFTKIFINNEWHNSVSGKTFPTINPTTEEKIADVQEGDKADVEKAVQAAVDAFNLDSTWRRMSAYDRGQLLFKLADLMEQNQDYLSKLESLDNGKPIESSLADIDFSIKNVRYYAGYADKLHGKTISNSSENFLYTRIEPVGVCGQIIPWNFPIMMLVWKISPALCAGNTVILKPAEQTPLTALYIANLIKEAGFPPGVVNIVPGFGETAGDALVRHPKVDKIAFTGSTEVGKLIMKNSSDTIKRVSLELGGKSPLVVSPNISNIQEAVKLAQQSCFYNMGQCCCAATRTYVHESIYDEFVRLSAEYSKRHVQGDPYDEKTALGPQVDETQMNKILDLIESGKKQGARLVAGGKRCNRTGYFVEPTVFADVKDDMRIAREEIFGPVQQILKYKSLDEVIERCNDTEYGLAAGILSNDTFEVARFTSRVRAGTIWVNSYMEFSSQLPFGGFKQSGFGRDLGEDCIRNYIEIKSVSNANRI